MPSASICCALLSGRIDLPAVLAASRSAMSCVRTSRYTGPQIGCPSSAALSAKSGLISKALRNSSRHWASRLEVQ